MRSRTIDDTSAITGTYFERLDPCTVALYHHPSIGVVVMDTDGRYVLVNPVAARFINETPENLLDKYHHEVFPGHSHRMAFDEVRARHWVCYSQRRPTISPLEPADCWDISIAVQRDGQGRHCGYLMLIQEVSSFRRAIQEAARQRTLFATLLEKVPAGVVIAQGAEGCVTMMNATARAMYGGVIEVGSSLAQLHCIEQLSVDTMEYLSINEHPLVTTIRTAQSLEGVNLCITSPAGHRMTLLTDCAPLGIWDGEPAAIAVFQDISGHAEHERKLESQNRQLQELDRAKDTFLANVSHELKTPLTAILGWVSTAREMGGPGVIDHALEVIERNAQRQAWLINDLLTLSNCLAGRLALRKEQVLLLTICEEAVARAQCAMQDAQVTVEIQVSPALMCHADPLRLRQLLENILTNALKFTPDEGTIRIAAAEKGEWICLQVTDTGIGLDQEDLQSVFRPFWQADTSPSRRYGGAGIGLTVVKELVTLHGGKVAVESAGAGEGTRFTVYLPVGEMKTPDPADVW